MPKTVNAGLAGKTDLPCQGAEHFVHRGITERPSPLGNEDVVIIGRRPLMTEVLLQRGLGAFVQGHQAALMELRFTNAQPVCHHVVDAQAQRFRDAQPSGRQQREQGGKGVRSGGTTGTQAPSFGEQGLQLSGREDERDGSSTVLTE